MRLRCTRATSALNLAGRRRRSFFTGGSVFDLRVLTLAALLAAGVTNSVATTNPPGTVVGSDGTIQYAPHNLATNSATGNAGVGGNTVTPNGIVAVTPPTGTTGAVSSYTMTNLAALRWGSTGRNDLNGRPFSAGVWARTDTGTATVFWDICDGATSGNITLTTSWQFISMLNSGVNSNGYAFADLNNATGSTVTIYICEPRVNVGPVLTTYVPTATGNPVYAPRLTCERGATRNLIPWSDDPTNAAWSNTTTTCTETFSPPTGYSRSWRLTNTGGGGSRITQDYVVPATGSFTWTLALRAGVNDVCTVLLYNLTDGTTIEGLTPDLRARTGLPARWRDLGGGWIELSISGTAAAGKSIRGYVYTGGSAGAVGSTVEFAGASLQPVPVGQVGPYLRTFASAPLYSAGTPTSQNLLAQGIVSVANGWNFGATSMVGSVLVPGTGNTVHYAYPPTPSGLVTGAVYTHTYRLRASGYRYAYIGVNSVGSAVFDLQAGTVGGISGVSARIASDGGGWYICRVSWTATASSSVAALYPMDNTQALTYAGDGTSGIEVSYSWMHEGTADLPYAATSGTPVSAYPQAGLLSEEQRTNSLRNSTMQGAAAGTPGTLPTNWTHGTINGVSVSQVATGTQDGKPYVDLRFQGTISAGGYVVSVQMDGPTSITAAGGSTWTLGTEVALVGGTWPANATSTIGIWGWTAAGVFVEANRTAQAVPTPLLTRYVGTNTLGATVERVQPRYEVNIASGTVDFTLRIAAPQLEQGAFATSYIPTTSAAVTRSRDYVLGTGLPGLAASAAAGTLYVEAQPLVAGTQPSGARWVSLSGAAPLAYDREVWIGTINASGAVSGEINQQGGPYNLVTADAVRPINRAVMVWSASQRGLAANGSTKSVAGNTVTPNSLDQLTFGLRDGSAPANALIRFVAFGPGAANDSQIAGLMNGTLQ